jgi:hypothetical protein
MSKTQKIEKALRAAFIEAVAKGYLEGYEKTIERCAQVAERHKQYSFGENDEYANGTNDAIRQIAAAIRALKDET